MSTDDVVAIAASIGSALEHLSPGELDVIAERRRQIEVKGRTPEHDDGHTGGELAAAAACYVMAAYLGSDDGFSPGLWPWADEWRKPSKSPRRDLVKAGALIIAEIERLDRAEAGATR